MQKLGKRLQRLRADRDLSRRQVAEAIGTTVTTVRDLEYHGSHRRLAELLPKLATFYEVDLRSLLGITARAESWQVLEDAKSIRTLSSRIIQGLTS